MNLKDLKGGRSLTAIVLESVGDFPIFELKDTMVREMYNGYQLEEYLEHLYPEKQGPVFGELDKVKEKILVSMVKKWGAKDNVNEYNLCDWDQEPDANYYSISFWAKPGKPLKAVIVDYLDAYESDLMETWAQDGGDDSWYDYMPSYTDVFCQLCKLFGEQDRYNKFVIWYRSILGDSEFSLYAEEI